MDIWQGLTLNRREPVYLQLVRQVKRLLLLGQLENGSRLPSRRETAAALEVNLNTVQKAFKLMEEQALLVTDGNLGSVIACSEEMRQRITLELTHGMAAEFVREAKELHLSFKQTIDLLSEIWENP